MERTQIYISSKKEYGSSRIISFTDFNFQWHGNQHDAQVSSPKEATSKSHQQNYSIINTLMSAWLTMSPIWIRKLKQMNVI